MSTGQIILGVVGGVAGFMTGGIGFALVGVAMGVAAGMAFSPTSSDAPSAGAPQVQNLDMPTIEEGTSIYDIFGTGKVVGHLLWYGNNKTKKIKEKVESGGKGGGGKTEKVVAGYKYYLTWAQGICLGPVDEVYTIFRDDDPVWSGNLTRPASGGVSTITLEGMGSCTIYFGTDDQPANATIGGVEGATANPPYRGLCWAFFDNCFIGTYNRCPVMRFVVRKTPALAFNSSHLIGTYDYNPAHLIYTVLTNSKYVGFPSTWVNEGSFNGFANLMAQSGEQHGLSMLFSKQEPGTRILEGILTHVDAIMRYGIDGKFHLHANRGYDDVSTLPVIDQSMFLKPMTLERRGWGEVANELQVQHHVRYNTLTDAEIPTAVLDPDDTLTGAQGAPPDPDRWTIVNINDTGVTNPPLFNASGALEWSGAKTAEGVGEDDYRANSRFWFGDDQYPTEVEFEFLVSAIAATGSGEWATPLRAGFGDDYLNDNGYYQHFAIATLNGTDRLVIQTVYGLTYGPILTAAHFPLKVRIRREVTSDTDFKVGYKYYDNTDSKWKNFSGVEDEWDWITGISRTIYSPCYFQMRFDLASGGGVTSASVTGGFANFKVVGGEWGCWVKSDADKANDDFTGDNGDPPDATKWTKSGTGYINNNQYYMTTAYDQITHKLRLQGDFDVQIDMITDPPPSGNTWGQGLLQIQPLDEGPSAYWITAAYGVQFTGSPYTGNWRGSIKSLGNETVNYSASRFSKVTSTFRVTRVGKVVTAYYLDFPDPGWNVMATRSDWSENDVQVLFRTVSTSANGLHIDNFIVNSADGIRNLESCADVAPAEVVLNIRRAAVTGDDKGAKEIHGRAVTKSAQLIGFGTTENANWAADRGIRRAAYPFAMGQLTLNRSAFKREVGDLFKLSDSEHNITDMVCRATLIGEGKLDSEEITITFMEEPDYVTNAATLSVADTNGARRTDSLQPLSNVAVVEAPYVLSGDNIEIIALAGREVGNEIGFELWVSIDNGTSYQFLENVEAYAVKGVLAAALGERMTTLDVYNTITVDFAFDDDAEDIETITRTAMLTPADNLMLIGNEIITFETITPDDSVAGRYHITNLNRGWYDTMRESHASGAVVWFLGTNIQRVASTTLIAGATRKFKMVPYNSRYVGAIADAGEVAHTVAGRGKQPYTPGNLRANGRGRYALYQMNVQLTWSPRVRGADAGINDPDSVTDAAPTWEGYFEVEVVVGGTTVRTVTGINVLNWTYTYAMNVADNGGLAGEVTFNLTNYIDATGVKYTSRAARSITVKRNPAVTATTTTTTTTT